MARDLLALGRPAVIRGNASEVLALTGGAGGKGVDSAHTPEAALDAARALALEHRTVVAVSGPVDHLTDGDRVVRVHNGHPWLTKVTGVGCALGALVAAFAAVVPDPLLARHRRDGDAHGRGREPPRRPAAAPVRSPSRCWTNSPRSPPRGWPTRRG